MGCRSSQHHGSVHESDGGPWRDLVLLCANFAVGVFPMERVPTFCSVPIVKTVEKLLEGKRIFHTRNQCRIFSQPMGCGVTHILYVLCHALATLYLPVVSSRSNISGHVVETLSRHGCSARLANRTPASSRYWLSFRNCAHYCSINFPSLHQANQQRISRGGGRGFWMASTHDGVGHSFGYLGDTTLS